MMDMFALTDSVQQTAIFTETKYDMKNRTGSADHVFSSFHGKTQLKKLQNLSHVLFITDSDSLAILL